MRALYTTLLCSFFSTHLLFGQVPRGYWQQEIAYDIQLRLDDEKNRLYGTEKVVYHNHSPDTLQRVFYHLYYNAFQPGSMMDMRARAITDPDSRLNRKLPNLPPEKQGYQKILSITQDGKPLRTQVNDTILTVWLRVPLLPEQQTTFLLDFETQVPVHIRRAGRDNRENIAYSMAQWYPKMAEYDAMGWHAHAYVGREFYGVWGRFDVKITLPSAYVVAGTGVLQNAADIGKGYATYQKKVSEEMLTWHFVAQDVHDFVWAADTDYLHDIVTLPRGTLLHFFYTPDYRKGWERLQKDMQVVFPLAEQLFGDYPYETYSIIQGGDGGMEYPMATLITAKRAYESLLGVVVHELMHSWFQGVLGSNESLYAWLDEGFTEYAAAKVLHTFRTPSQVFNPSPSTYRVYRSVVEKKEERMNTWADHFTSNRAYSVASYVKGGIFQHQLGYIVGREVLAEALLTYYDTWKFKHPAPMDYLRVVERASGMELDWYYEYFVNTTHTIDYAIDAVSKEGTGTKILLRRKGHMPMPIDLYVRYKNNTEAIYTIPLAMMNGYKRVPNMQPLPPWHWTSQHYEITLSVPPDEIASIEIDRTRRLADSDESNQFYPSVVTEGLAPSAAEE